MKYLHTWDGKFVNVNTILEFVYRQRAIGEGKCIYTDIRCITSDSCLGYALAPTTLEDIDPEIYIIELIKTLKCVPDMSIIRTYDGNELAIIAEG